jgi:heavy metal sensor kinase
LLGAFCVFIYFFMSNTMYQEAAGLIKAHTAQAASYIEYEDRKIKLEELNRFMISGTHINIYDASDKVIAGTTIEPKLNKLPRTFNRLRRIDVKGDAWLLYDKPVYQEKKIVAWIRATRSLEPATEVLRNLVITVLIAIPVCILIATLGGLFLSKKALSPIDYITKTARAIGRGDLSQRLRIPKTEDEVGRLAIVFDEMLDKLESFFRRERQFTSDASHELRTPLAVISAEAEEALTGDKGKEDLRDALTVIVKENKKMSILISQLLKLTRSDENEHRLEIENLDLGIVTEEVMDEMQAAAEQKKINLRLRGDRNIPIRGDQTLITSLLINLIDNAIYHNSKGTTVDVDTALEDNKAKIVVEDNGIGIEAEDLEHIFERFYRVDKARSGDKSGLGLPIAKWIVEAHKGSIRVESKPGKGTRFEILLPLEQ